LSYESSGASDGVPILGLHDLLADRGQLRPLGDTLHDRFRLTLPDARGHGASPMISGRAYPMHALAADALAVLDAEGLTQVHIAAIGWGAGIALVLALDAPERVASLILAQPYLPTLIDQADSLETVHEAADAAEKGQTDRALDLYLGMRLGPDWRDGLPKSRLGAMRRAAASLAPLLSGIMGASFTREDLEHIAIPMTIFLREDTPTIELQTAELLAALPPQSRLMTFQSGSDAHRTSDDAWAAVLAQMLVAGW
jgi:pimeloyl-ACP methyl ester carboxylesterase